MDIEMLQEDRLRAWCTRLKMPEGGIEALVNTARDIQTDSELLAIFTAFYEQTALRGEWHREWADLRMDALVVERMGRRASLFYLLGYLAALPQAEREYRRLGVGMQIFNDTMLDFSIWLQKGYDLHGEWVFTQFAWMWRHVDCKLFRLGRLQFMLQAFPGNVTAFRNRSSGRILLLADPNTALRVDGYAEGAGGKPSGEDPWYPAFEPTPAGWRGNRVTPQGFVLHEQSFLLRSEWERILKPGDTVLDLHIPTGDKLTEQDCRASFEQAYQFFPAIFPEYPFKGVYCHTWFFTPQLQQILPTDSNIVHFQREFYLFPFAGGPKFLWDFVFGDKYPDAASAPRDTSLRRAVLDWLANGGELFDMPGLMLHAPEQWGSQPYYNNVSIQAPVKPAAPPVLAAPKSPWSDDDEADTDLDDDYDEAGDDDGFSDVTDTNTTELDPETEFDTQEDNE